MTPDQPNSSARPAALPCTIEEAAVDWLVRRDCGFDEASARAFSAWLAADPRHAAALAALEPAWSALHRARTARRGSHLREHVGAIVRRRRRRIGLAITAAAAALVLGFFYAPPRLFAPSPDSSIALRPDRRVLPDGSTVELNRDAQIAVDFTADARTVRLLRGEAHFEVTRNPSRPFIVSTGRVAVRAVGTAFSVRLETEAIDVLVTEGRVAVEQSPPPAEPSPARPAATPPLPTPIFAGVGDRVVVPVAPASVQASPTLALAPQRVSPAHVAQSLAWRQRRIEFDGTSLAEAVQLFNRDNTLHLRIADRETAALRITGVFWTTDPQAFARALENTLGVTASPQPDGRLLLRK